MTESDVDVVSEEETKDGKFKSKGRYLYLLQESDGTRNRLPPTELEAPVVDVEFHGTTFATAKRWEERFREAVVEARDGGKFAFVFAAYTLSVQGNAMVRWLPRGGACSVWRRGNSKVYRGLYQVLVHAGFMCIVIVDTEGVSDATIRFVPREDYATDEGEEDKGKDIGIDLPELVEAIRL